MRLTTAMLADAAQVQGGKLFVLGGGFDTISVRSLPVVHRSLAVALVAVVSPEERHRDLEIVIGLIDEDGQSLGVEAKGKLRVGAPPNLPPVLRAWCPSSRRSTTCGFPMRRDTRSSSAMTRRSLPA